MYLEKIEENDAGLSWCRKMGSFPLIIHKRKDKMMIPCNDTNEKSKYWKRTMINTRIFTKLRFVIIFSSYIPLLLQRWI